MDSCPGTEQLERFLEGGLTAADAAAVTTHVQGCAACQERLEQLTGEDADGPGLSPAARETLEAPAGVFLDRLKGLAPALPSLEPQPRTDPLCPTGPGPRPAEAVPLPAVDGYEVLAELGRGGMGVVYQARHLGLGRLVALKMLLRPEHADPETFLRFRIEGETLARVQHPHVVQIHEVGVQHGTPFFALEYVPGGGLAARLDGRPQPPRQAAQLIETLARAVHAAHLHGVVHRDLKPANILLTADGTPKITDFGIAKPVQAAAGLTASGIVIGSPSYMAPEQARGQAHAIGPAADVYALGVILYELLTGQRPFHSDDLLEQLRQVKEDEPTPPARLVPGLPRDLNSICLRCLEKEPHRRFASALALADDLRRFLDGVPVHARPVGRIERAAKWVRRRPLVAALSAAVIVLAVGGFGLVTWQWRRAVANERLAEERFQQARQAVDDFYTEVSENPRLLVREPGTQELRRALLEKARAYYDGFLRERGDDPSVRVVTAAAYFRLAHLTAQLRPGPGAVELYEKARDLWQQLAERQPASREVREQLAKTWHNLGTLQSDLGRLDQALASYEQAGGLRERLVEENPDNRSWQRQLAHTYSDLGVLHRDAGRADRALASFAKAEAIQDRLVQAEPANPEFRQDLAKTYNNVGVVYQDQRRLREARASFEKARALREALAREHPERPDLAHDLARIHCNLANVCYDLGEPAEATAACERAAPLLDKLVRENPAVLAYGFDLFRCHNLTGLARDSAGRRAEARAAYTEACRLGERLVREHPAVSGLAVEVGGTCCNLGNLLSNADGKTAALEWYAKGVALLDPVVAREPGNRLARQFLRNTLWGRAGVLTNLRRAAEALPDWERALRLNEGAAPFGIRQGRAAALARLGRHAEAVAEARALHPSDGLPANQAWALAGVYSLAAAAVRRDSKLSAGEQDQKASACVEQAVRLLQRAAARGYLKAPAMAEALAEDPDWEPVRAHPAFAGLVPSSRPHP